MLTETIKQLLVDRHDKNGQLFNLFFVNPSARTWFSSTSAGTYDEFRREMAV